ncbi:MAG: MoaD/ThiS family protein [Saprospiraceae bacterium]
MQIKILPFGIAKEIVGSSAVHLTLEATTTTHLLKKALFEQYPALERLNSLAIAVNGEYAADDLTLQPGDEVVLIPPVSGG